MKRLVLMLALLVWIAVIANDQYLNGYILYRQYPDIISYDNYGDPVDTTAVFHKEAFTKTTGELNRAIARLKAKGVSCDSIWFIAWSYDLSSDNDCIITPPTLTMTDLSSGMRTACEDTIKVYE